MSYPTYMPMMQPGASFSQRPAMQPQPMRQMYGGNPPVIRVNGRPGADAFILGPNEEVILIDANEDIFYHKTTDGAGYPTTREFDFKLRTAATAAAVDYATRDELETLRAEISELKGVLSNAKQPVRAKITKAAAEPEE